jgi:hypothetical protein
MDGDAREGPWAGTFGPPDPACPPEPPARTNKERLRQSRRAVRRRAHRRSRYRGARWAAAGLIALFMAVTQWLSSAHIPVGRWASGGPHTTIGFLPYILLILLLILPDADSVAFGGLRLEMRRTQQEVSGLRDQVTQLQVAQAEATATAAAIGALTFATDSPEVARLYAAAFGVPARVAENEQSGLAPRSALTSVLGAARPGTMAPGQP